MDAMCKTCPFWTRNLPRADDSSAVRRGVCHHVHASAGDDSGMRYEDWFCSEHPHRQRDRLAAMAMQGLLATDGAAPWPDDRRAFAHAVSEDAYAVADAMLAARAKGEV